MLGIPETGTPEFTTFSISFWAALYSGLIYSLFTGIIVGFVVWRMQVVAERRAQKNRYEEDLIKLKENLKYVNFDQNVLNITSAKQSIPQTVNEIVKLVIDKPLGEWHQKLSKHNHFIQRLIEIQKQKIEFDRLADQLDFQLVQFIRLHNSSRNAIAVNDPAHHKHFIGRLHNFTIEQIKPYLDSGSLETLEISYSAAKENASVKVAGEAYLLKRQSLIDVIALLKTALFETKTV